LEADLPPKESQLFLEAVALRHASLEAQRDVPVLYEFINPEIRQSRDERIEFGPELTISTFRDYVQHIESAKVQNISVDAFTEDGGPLRRHRRTACLCSAMDCNGGESVKEYCTPWVLESGRWYTRAVGKTQWPLGA